MNPKARFIEAGLAPALPESRRIGFSTTARSLPRCVPTRPTAAPGPFRCRAISPDNPGSTSPACCATNTGCPLKGVCLPSFRGLAAPNRFISRSSASARTALRPFLSRYLNSRGHSRNRCRNGDLTRSSKSWSMSFVEGLRQSRVTLDARTTISSWRNSRSS